MKEIKFRSGPLEGQRINLSRKRYTMGRNSNLDITLDDHACSGDHAELRLDGDEWKIFDHHSSNGTWLNGKRIESATVASGDVIQVGDTKFVFREAADTAGEPSQKQVDQPVVGGDEMAIVQKMRAHADSIRREVGKVIVGQTDVLDQILMCILAGGHALLIGLPGMAKTLTVRTIAQVLNLKFKRVQFTPDLMPGDIIGTDVLETNPNTGEKEFRFIRGPIFCNLLLADEINRTPPKTQAALLEAMQEKMVTAGNTSYKLDEPFFVLATQNPIEQEGTYPLPEAQLDRFMFNIWVDYPLPHEEEEILRATTGVARVDPQPVLTQQELLQLQSVVRKVPVSDHVIKYVTRLVGATRRQNADAPQVTKTFVTTGAGPRAGQYLILAAKAMAILDGRIHVSCSDIRRAAPPVLRHRIITNFAADSEGLTPLDIIKKLLEEVPEPGPEAYAEKPKK